VLVAGDGRCSAGRQTSAIHHVANVTHQLHRIVPLAFRDAGEKGGRPMRTIIAAFVLMMLSGLTTPSPASPTCGYLNNSNLPAVRKILLDHGFSRAWVGQAEIKSVGRITVKRSHYDIYWSLHVTPSGACHGTQIVFVIENHRGYMGSYLVHEEPTGIDGRDVLFATENGNRLHFDGRGPPTHGVLDGEPILLNRSVP
jgi:hypothetical protein